MPALGIWIQYTKEDVLVHRTGEENAETADVHLTELFCDPSVKRADIQVHKQQFVFLLRFPAIT